jgi:hypothetical protein
MYCFMLRSASRTMSPDHEPCAKNLPHLRPSVMIGAEASACNQSPLALKISVIGLSGDAWQNSRCPSLLIAFKVVIASSLSCCVLSRLHRLYRHFLRMSTRLLIQFINSFVSKNVMGLPARGTLRRMGPRAELQFLCQGCEHERNCLHCWVVTAIPQDESEAFYAALQALMYSGRITASARLAGVNARTFQKKISRIKRRAFAKSTPKCS